MNLPRLTQIASELVSRMRRPRVLGYATPVRRPTLWQRICDVGDPRWLLLALAGLAIIVGSFWLGRRSRGTAGFVGGLLLLYGVRRWRGDDPY